MKPKAGPELSPGQHQNRANTSSSSSKGWGNATGRVEGTAGQARDRVGSNTKRLVLQE